MIFVGLLSQIPPAIYIITLQCGGEGDIWSLQKTDTVHTDRGGGGDTERPYVCFLSIGICLHFCSKAKFLGFFGRVERGGYTMASLVFGCPWPKTRVESGCKKVVFVFS